METGQMLPTGRPRRRFRLVWGCALGLGILAGGNPAAAAGAAAPPLPARPPIALVLPFANGTGERGMDWIGVALQDAINVDLWYVGALHTWDLPNMVEQTQQPPLAIAVDDPAEVAKLVARLTADVVLAGRYRVAGDRVTITARLVRPGAAGPPAERTESGPLGSLTDLASRLTLDLLAEAKVPVGAEERARILITKTRSAEALRANGRGFEAYGRHGLKPDEALLREALQRFEEAVKLDPRYAEAWNNLAWAQFVARDYGQAVPSFERAVGLRVDLIDALVGLGKARIAADLEDSSALPPLEAAVRLNPNLAGHRVELAEVLEALGEESRAAQELEAAERIVAGRIAYVEADVHLRTARLLVERGDPDAAGARLQRARDLYRASGSKGGEVRALQALGELAVNRKDLPAARRHYGEALALVRQLGDRGGETVLLNALGMAALEEGDAAAAEGHFAEALKASREAGDKEGQVLSLLYLSLVAQGRGDLARAQSLLLEALPLARQIGDGQAEAAIEERLREIRKALGRRDAI